MTNSTNSVWLGRNVSPTNGRWTAVAIAAVLVLAGCDSGLDDAASAGSEQPQLSTQGQTQLSGTTLPDTGALTPGLTPDATADVAAGDAATATDAGVLPARNSTTTSAREQWPRRGDNTQQTVAGDPDPSPTQPVAPRPPALETPVAVADVPEPPLRLADGTRFVPVAEILGEGRMALAPLHPLEHVEGAVLSPTLEAGDVVLGFIQQNDGTWLSTHGFSRVTGEFWVDVGGTPFDYGVLPDGVELRRPRLTTHHVQQGTLTAGFVDDTARGSVRVTPAGILWRTESADGTDFLVRYGLQEVVWESSSAPARPESRVSWTGAWNEADLRFDAARWASGTEQYVVHDHGVEQHFVVATRPSQDTSALRLREVVELNAGYELWAEGAPIGLGEKVTTHSHVWILSDSGRTLPVAPAFSRPFVVDAAGVNRMPGGFTRNDALIAHYEVTRLDNTRWQFDTVVDGRFLLHPDVQYPVTVDPNVTWMDVMGQFDDLQDWEEPFTMWAARARTQYHLQASQLGIPAGSVMSGFAWYNIMDTWLWGTPWVPYMFERRNAYNYAMNTADTHFTYPGATSRGAGYFAWYSTGAAQWFGTAARWVATGATMVDYCFPYFSGNCVYAAHDAVVGWWGEKNSDSTFQNQSNTGANDLLYTGSNLRLTSGHDAHMWFNPGGFPTSIVPFFDFRFCPAGGSGRLFCELYVRDQSTAGINSPGGLSWDSFPRTRIWYHAPRALAANSPYVDSSPAGWHNLNMYSFVVPGNFCPGAGDVVVRTTAGTANGDTRLWAYNSGFAQLAYNDNNGVGINTWMSAINLGKPAPGTLYYFKVDEHNRDAAINYNISVEMPLAGVEICDGLDNDCDGLIDEGLRTRYYYDADNDTWGTNDFQDLCAPTGLYRATRPGDCNDNNAAINPGAAETVGNNVDQNCDGFELCYFDTDNDGYRRIDNGYGAVPGSNCNIPGYKDASAPGGDCNDNNASINPGATEIVGDEIDQNCDGREICYLDADNDGYRPGPGTATILSLDTDCRDSQEALATAPVGDCNDNNPLIYPGAFERCDGIDNNCNSVIDEGYNVGAACDDADPDLCLDGVILCAPDGLSAVCENRGPSVYYPMNLAGVSTLTDWSGNRNNANLVNGAFVGDLGNERGAFLDGANDFIEIPASPLLRSRRQVTIAMWVHPREVSKPLSCDANNNWRWLLNSDASINGGPNLIYEQNQSLNFSIFSGGVSARFGTAGSTVPTNTWTHVAFTYDADTGTARFYRNGVLTNTWAGGPTQDLAGHINPVRVGNASYNSTACPNGNGAFEGIVDDIYYAGRALTAAEVSTIHRNGPVGALINAEVCDGFNNDCTGGADDSQVPQAGMPFGVTYTAPGTACEGPDDDLCNEGGRFVCFADTLGSFCGDGTVLAIGYKAPVGSQARDLSGWNNHGQMYNNVTWDAAQDAFRFNAGGTDNGYIEIPGTSSLFAPAGFTVEAWVRPEAGGSNWQGIVGQVGTTSRVSNAADLYARSFHLWLGNNDIPGGAFAHGVYGCPMNWAAGISTGGGSVANNGSTWTHVVYTVDTKGQQVLYINGVAIASAAACGTNIGASLSGRPLYLGRNLDGAGANYFRGWMRRVSVYNYALGAAAVAANASAGTGPANTLNLELCDGLDNDCRLGIDDPYNTGGACDGPDADFCLEGVNACTADGWGVACNDNTGSTFEICNGADDDCDGLIDEGLTQTTFYRDADGDGFGDPARSVTSCATSAPAGYVGNNADCSDASASVYPGAPEVCNGFDDNCNGTVDEGNPGGGAACTADAFGICANGTSVCQTPTTGYAPPTNDGFIRQWLVLGKFPATDCTDTAATPPAAAALPYEGLVQTGRTWARYDAASACGGACGGNGIDLACALGGSTDNQKATLVAYVYSPVARTATLRLGSDDGARVWLNGSEVALGAGAACRGCTADENQAAVNLVAGRNVLFLSVANGTTSWAASVRFTAADGIGLRDLRISTDPGGQQFCEPGQPITQGGVPVELCNGLDDDCDGVVPDDELDLDGDGFTVCGGLDCDDTNPDVYPGAPELCDGIDNDCNPVTPVDFGFNVGQACDGNDADLCLDGVMVCNEAGTGTYCANTGPVAAYDFRDGSGLTATDISGNGRTMTLQGGITYGTSGLTGPGLVLNGVAGQGRIPATAFGTYSGTLEMWARSPVLAAGAPADWGFFQVGDASTAGDWFAFYRTGNTYRVSMAALGLGCCGNDLTFPAQPQWQDGSWVHWTVTWNANSATPGSPGLVTVYANGVVVASTSVVFNRAPVSTNAYVGVGGLAASRFPGVVDDIAIYEVALDAGRVITRAQAGRLDTLGINLEMCDGGDNDCDGAVDEGFPTLGAQCDGDDADLCLDGRQICAVTTLGSECSGGAGAALLFRDDLGDLQAFDSTANANHGQLTLNTGGVTFAGRAGVELRKDRNSRMVLPVTIGEGTDFSVGGWFRPDPANTDLVEALFSRTTTASTGCDGNGLVAFTDGTVWLQCETMTSPVLADRMQNHRGEWTHVLLTYDRDRLRLYVNGAQVVSRRWEGADFRTITWTSALVVGQDQDIPNGGFEDDDAFGGAVGEFVWYRHAVTGAEVATLYTSGVPAIDVNYEYCDGLDNDCDTVVDQNDLAALGAACTVGLGVCAAPGTQICADDGFGTACDGTPGAASPESCDALDNDCDGSVDEDFPDVGGACSVGAGACLRTGSLVCLADGSGTACSATPALPTDEVCNNIDDDCDGNIDEGVGGGQLFQACYPGAPADVRTPPALCTDGLSLCTAGTLGPCVGFTLPATERCDAVDRDCDGDTVNGFNVGAACNNGQLGVCYRDGAFACNVAGTGTECSAPFITPGVELCGDGLDNDCDGPIDEGIVTGTVAVDGVSSGVPTFDWSTCDMSEGSPVCSAVTFTVTNTSGVGIAAGAPVVLSVNGVAGTISTGQTLPRAVAPGTSETFVYCWRNLQARPNAVVVVTVDTGCNTLSSDASSTPPSRLVVCGDEICDGADNDGDGRVDELPDACGFNPTLSCVNDRTGYRCVPTLGDADACIDGACAAGQQCVSGRCESGCAMDAHCPVGLVCEAGICTAQEFSAPAVSAEEAAEPAPDATPAPSSQTAANDDSTQSTGPSAGCASAPAGIPATWLVLLGFAPLLRRRRAA